MNAPHRDIETDADQRSANLVGALEAVADLLFWAQPGAWIENERLAPLLRLLAEDARALHESAGQEPTGKESAPCR